MFNDLSKSQIGMILAMAGFTSYAMSDICAKWNAQDISVYQIIMLNNLSACGFMLLALPKLGGIGALTRLRYKRLHILRAILNIAISITILQAFVRLPIADTYTFIFVMPFYAAILGIFLYKEPVGRNRWIAIIVGFAGVVLALQPGAESFNTDYLWAIGSGVLIALMFTVSKSMQEESLFALGFWPSTANVLGCGIIMLISGFEPVSITTLVICIFNGLFISIGIVCVSNAFRMAPAAAVSPFLYTEMIWALLFGYFLFGDVPNAMMLAGAGIVITAGFYLIETERRDRRKT